MTRKRTRENLVQQLCEPCGYCEGRGYVLSAESVAFKVMREIRKDLPNFCGRQIAIAVNSEVAEMLLGPARKALAALSEELGREIEIRARPGLHQDQFEVTALDEGPAVAISLRWLEERKSDTEETDEEELLAIDIEGTASAVESASEAALESPAESTAEAEGEPVPSLEPEVVVAEEGEEIDDPTAAVEAEAVDPPAEVETSWDLPPDGAEIPRADAAPEAATESLTEGAEPQPRESQMVDSIPENPILPPLEDRKES